VKIFKSKILIVVLITFITTFFANACIYAAPVENIAELQKKPVTDLTEYNKVLAQVDESNCTVASWTIYQKVVKASVVTASDNQIKVDWATFAIRGAQYLLIVDLKSYNLLLGAVTKDGYTQLSWDAYQIVVNQNKVKEHDNAVEVTKKVRNIREQQAKLEADLTAYDALLAKVHEKDFTVASWKLYQLVVIDKVNVMTSKNTPAEVVIAIKNITDAQLNLVLKADLKAYNAAIALVPNKNRINYTKKIWDTYQAVVKANYVTTEDTQLKVDAATKNILDAQKYLISDLTEYNKVLNQVDKSNCTPKSWETYEKVVSSNTMTTKNTQPQVEWATFVIGLAQWGLKVDLTAYNALLAVTSNGYTQTSWAAYQIVVNKNIVTVRDNAVVVTNATRNIAAAQQNLEADLTEYNRVLSSVAMEDYTSASWLIYQGVVSANTVTIKDTPAKVAIAIDAIKLAQKSLVFAGQAALDAAMLDANSKVDSDYTIASWKLLVDAKALLATTNALVVTKTNAINEAIEGLVFAGQADLEAAVLNAISKAKCDYTAASWSSLTSAQALPETTNALVVAKTIAINDAVRGLVFAGKADLEAAILNANSKAQADYTVASWSALTSARALPETTNTLVVAKTNAINNAIKGLVFAGKANLDTAKANAATKVQSMYTVVSWTALTNALALPETTNALIVTKTNAINNAISTLALASVKYKVIAYVGLNCRVAPNMFAIKVRAYSYGTILEITETVNGWGRTQHGWVYMSYLTKVDTATPVVSRYQVTPYIGLNCRVSPTIYSNKVTAYSYRTMLEISEILSGWGKTQRGWVCMQYLAKI
jgi:hypothetical protein